MDKELQGKIEAQVVKNPRLKRQIDSNVKRAKLRAQKQTSEQQGEPQQGPTTPYMAFASQSAFSVDRDSYELKNMWILDSGANAHVCNDHTRFKYKRTAREDENLVAGKTVYQIEAFGSVEITIQSPIGPKSVTLLDVALTPGFFTNTASLHRFTSKRVHWDTQGSRLHTNGKTFCSVQRVGSHWALEHAPAPSPPPPLSSFAFGTPSNAPREPVSAPSERWHAVMGHLGQEPLSHLQANATGAIVTKSAPTTFPGETCAVSKAHEIVSRRTTKETPAEAPMARVAYDLIQMAPAYNNNQWISHFRDYHTKMDFVYTHHSKGQATAIVESFLNLIKSQYQLSPRYFRTGGENVSRRQI
jgi:hypothetical protein